MSDDAWPLALLAAVAVHAGFQLAVTVLVYPALAEVGAERWAVAHARHSRRITPLVAVVYLGLLTTVVGALLAGRSPATVTTAAAVAVAFGLTAAGAAPLHGRLGERRDDVLVRRLVRLDRLRTVAALVALAAALAGM